MRTTESGNVDHERANKCDCEDAGIPAGWVCGKPDCHRTLAANAWLQKAGRRLYDAITSREKI